ncbi:MAG: NAD-dependent epimerase/dehydratase family protein, partial [Candidatus Bathyarchaeota archaeon]|nr:NAD-dependent epimerase/dehydratase family protein [Candidatus Bathyarchaeota archaeon]
MIRRVLVTGAAGQIGSELTPELREKFGSENVVASDIREPSSEMRDSGPYMLLDITDRDRIMAVVQEYEVDAIF